MILRFVRHGQTDFNVASRLQGRAFDEDINDVGASEMEKLAAVLPRDVEVIYSSPLRRTLHSARIIERHLHIPIIIKSEISEKDVGTIAGKTWNDIPGGESLKTLDEKQLYDYRPFGGESAQDVGNRIQKFFTDVKKSGYRSAIVVSSIGVIRMAYKLIQGIDVLEVENASVHDFII